MRTSTSNYDTYNANLYKQPVYIVEFGAISTKFVSGTFNNIGSFTTNKYLRHVKASYGKIDIHTPDLTASTFEVEITDSGSGFTSFMNTNSLWGIALIIKVGFQELNYADFTTLTPTNTVVTDIKLSRDLTTWIITARDNLFGLVGVNFNEANEYYPGTTLENLSLNINDSFTTALEFTGNFTEIATSFGGPLNSLDSQVFACLKIDNEIIKYTGKTSGPPASYDTLTRGMGGTTPASHTSGAAISNGIGFACDPLRTMLHLLTSSEGGGNGPYDLSIDVTTNNFRGMFKNRVNTPITYTNINISGIEQLGWRLFHEAEYRDEGYFFLFWDETDNVLDTIQDSLLKPHGLYLIVNGGLIDVGHNDYVYFSENFSASSALTDSNIKSVSGIEHSGYEEVYDRYIFNDAYDWATGQYGEFGVSANRIIHNNTASTYYDGNILIVGHIGAVATLDPDTILHLVRYRFGSFADISTIIRTDCIHSQILLEPGDTPSVTTTYLANIDAGSRGWSTVKARLLGQELSAGPDESLIENELRVFTIPGYVDNAVSGYYAINKVVQGSIDDTTLAVSTDLTATTEAADAYYDNSTSAYQADRIVFFITITPPGFGGGSTFEIIDLQISWLDSVPAIQNSDRRRYIGFNPQSSTAFTIALDLYGKNSTADTPDRVKVDWNSTTATGSEIPTVAFTGVWFIKSNLSNGGSF